MHTQLHKHGPRVGMAESLGVGRHGEESEPWPQLLKPKRLARGAVRAGVRADTDMGREVETPHEARLESYSSRNPRHITGQPVPVPPIIENITGQYTCFRP
jgi:hypothetical protein